jgi:hypothetical protein
MHACIAPNCALRAPTVFSERTKKRIRSEKTVMNKTRDSAGVLSKIVDGVRMCFSSARRQRSARPGRRPRHSADER